MEITEDTEYFMKDVIKLDSHSEKNNIIPPNKIQRMRNTNLIVKPPRY